MYKCHTSCTFPPNPTEQVRININIVDSLVQESDASVGVEVILSSPATEDIVVDLLPVGDSATGSYM